ncbi:MAG TPA: DUF4440 domain-containing protein [Bacteroidota bacterium]|nr:DUF4440 domain-containing protein [Bacteroidota bacterium]
MLIFGISVLSARAFGRISADSAASVKIRAVLDAQVAAWNNGDIPGYMRGYWNSDSLIFTSGGAIRRGWQATLEKYKSSYDTKEKMGELSFSDLEVHVLSSTSAWCLGHWDLKRANDNPHGVFTLILRKFIDGWKIVHDHTSSSP